MNIPKKILERRKAVRIQESLTFQIGHQGYEIQARTINISLVGALCIVQQDIPMLTQLSIAMQLPGNKAPDKPKWIQAKGVIVRKEKSEDASSTQLAIYFSDIKPKDQKILKDFIQSRVKNA